MDPRVLRSPDSLSTNPSQISPAEEVLYYVAGILFLGLAKAQYHVRGYQPKPLDSKQVDACIEYDKHIASYWLNRLSTYTGAADERTLIAGKDILELGPGTDLGQGACLLHRGAGSYTAFDRHDNRRSQSAQIYSGMRAQGIHFDDARLNLIVDPQFSLQRHFAPHSFDIIVSNSAFEHFDDVKRVIEEMTPLVRPGGFIVLGVGPVTHSRWISHRDPNNIYRYPDWLYRLFYFPGQVNRVRPVQYLQYLRECQWRHIQMFEEQQTSSVGRGVARRFRTVGASRIRLLHNAGTTKQKDWRERTVRDMDITTFTLVAHK